MGHQHQVHMMAVTKNPKGTKWTETEQLYCTFSLSCAHFPLNIYILWIDAILKAAPIFGASPLFDWQAVSPVSQVLHSLVTSWQMKIARTDQPLHPSTCRGVSPSNRPGTEFSCVLKSAWTVDECRIIEKKGLSRRTHMVLGNENWDLGH